MDDEAAAAINERLEAAKKQRIEAAQARAEAAGSGERSVFHGKQLTDYQGRTYIWPPTDVKPHAHECFVPNKKLHEWKGHTKAVNRVRLFPDYGHLLLSASMDGTVKIWDYGKTRRCLRTMYGHGEAVRDICFSADGRHFLSCGYDRVVRHWDTETGQVSVSFGGIFQFDN